METRPLAEVRQDLSRFVEEAVSTHTRIDITRNGKRAAVLLSAEDYDSLVETLDVLADAALVRDIQHALAELEVGGGVTHSDIVADLAARRGARE